METYDHASLRVAIPDYILEGKTGCKTFSPEVFPRQTYEIDYIRGLFKTDMMSQIDLNGASGLVEIERGPIVSDRAGWKCSEDLPAGAEFRQWNVQVTIAGRVRYGMAFAVPDANGRYLYPFEMPSFTTEFFANTGLFQVFYWEFACQKEAQSTWRTMSQWKVLRDDGLPGRPYGVRVAQVGGRSVLELSNTGGSPPYLPLNTVFDLPENPPALRIRAQPPDVVLSWDTHWPGYVVYQSDSLRTTAWSTLADPLPSAAESCVVTTRCIHPQGFFRLGFR